MVLPAVGASMPLQNQSSSPMMAGLMTAPQMNHDLAVSMMPGAQPQLAMAQQPMQMVPQQPGSVSQMQVLLVCLCYHPGLKVGKNCCRYDCCAFLPFLR